MARPIFGTCHICGTHGRLSFEHVPPKAAFNDRRVLHTAFEKIIGAESLDDLEGRFQQRGASAYTLCAKCNNDTGHWYAGAYADWAYQAMRILIGTRGQQPFLLYPFNLFPLRVLKQVVCMFFSVNGPQFQQKQTDLVRFVLNPTSRIFPPRVRVYAFHTLSTRSRAIGVTGILTGFGGGGSTVHVLSEVTFPPFGFVMTLGNTPSPDPRFLDISGFTAFEYQDWRAGITMHLPLMSIYTGFPGDYRTREQTLADVAVNKLYEAQLRDGHVTQT